MRASGALLAAAIKNLGHAVLPAKALVEGSFDIPEIAHALAAAGRHLGDCRPHPTPSSGPDRG
ncbi:MAG TPA: hypothetical protein VFA87_11170 [Rhizomicrobium sp.]|nr:hypothetical protein [Rhizomicrobium sp.]